jgi:glycosyltransferase involved in cell wall biosynthesis
MSIAIRPERVEGTPASGPRLRRHRIAVLYHYFPPDDVVSARHYGDLCAGLAERGWDVTAMPSNRGCHDSARAFPLCEDWGPVRVRRVWRPPLRQSSGVGRLLNAAWMVTAWCGKLLAAPRPFDVVLVGTDPVLGVLVAPVVRRLCADVRVAHWCFDLYPEGPIADGMIREDGWAARATRRLLRPAYRSCHLVADLGGCMRGLLERYGHAGRKVTLTPWALAEPPEAERADPEVRRELFGDGTLGLLYSGNLGRGHSFTEFLDLARRLRGSGVRVAFGVRGGRADALRDAVRPDDTNVTLAGFAPEARLVQRLAGADVHLVSLRPEWTGVVVPSKFFGALAVGRPVLFAGPRDSALARWIKEYGVGWVLDDGSTADVAAELQALAAAPGRLGELQRHCHRVYQQHFARERLLDDWDRELRALLTAPRRPGS